MDGTGLKATEAAAASPDVSYAQEKEALRRKAFKATIDQEDSRRRREENQIKIRKEKKMSQLAKRRQVSGVGAARGMAGCALAWSQLACGVARVCLW